MHIARSVLTYGLTEEMAAAVVESREAAPHQDYIVKPLTFGRDSDAANVGVVVALLAADSLDPTELLKDPVIRQSPLAVIYLVERPTTTAIVAAMRRGAFDVVEWPAERSRLGSAIELGLATSVERKRRLVEVETARHRLEVLTSGELEVLKLMLAGKVNKSIAGRLSIALRTVEARRKRIFEKLGTRSLPEIAGTLNRTGLLGLSPPPTAPTNPMPTDADD